MLVNNIPFRSENMNLQKLDKQKSIRSISLKNMCKAYLWRKSHSHLKFIEFLTNNLNQSGKKFVILLENIDFFFAVKEKYEDIADAKEFIDEIISELNTSDQYHHAFYFWDLIDMQDVIANAINNDEVAINKLVNRTLMYMGAYDLLFEVIAKALTGYTFDTAYFEITNSAFLDGISETSEAHRIFADYFKSDDESEYEFKPYRLDSTSEYLLSADVSVLTGIVSDITDVNITYHDVTPTSREGKIFEEPEREFSRTAKLYEFDNEPYIEFGELNIKVSPDDLRSYIYVCSVYIGNFNGTIDTFHKDSEVTVDDVAQCIKSLLKTDVYVHTKQRETMSDYIEISWIESL